MEEQERVMDQVFERDGDYVPCANEPGMGVSGAPFGLEAPFPQPLVRESKARAAMVVLSIVDPKRVPLLEDGAVARHTVRNAREELRQVERGIGLVTDTEEEHLPVQFVHPTDGTFGAMGRNGKGTGGDRCRLRAGRRKSKRVAAAHHPGQPPEGVRHDAEVRRRRCGRRIERLAIVSRPRGHGQRAIGTEGGTERLDQAERASLDRPYDPEGRVDEQDPTLPDTERAELARDLVSA